MAYIVVYDACVLHPAPLRDLLIRLARAGLVQARWTDTILDECFRSIVRRRPELQRRLQRTRELMHIALPEASIQGYEGRIGSLHLPDPDDRHVLAAAIHCGAEAIVTMNLSDFPAHALAAHEIEARHPDAFVAELLRTAPRVVRTVLLRQAADLRAPPRSPHELLDILHEVGMPRTADQGRNLIDQ